MKRYSDEEAPFRSFRMPTREADQMLVKAAQAAGVTASEFIRRALAAALATEGAAGSTK